MLRKTCFLSQVVNTVSEHETTGSPLMGEGGFRGKPLPPEATSPHKNIQADTPVSLTR